MGRGIRIAVITIGIFLYTLNLSAQETYTLEALHVIDVNSVG